MRATVRQLSSSHSVAVVVGFFDDDEEDLGHTYTSRGVGRGVCNLWGFGAKEMDVVGNLLEKDLCLANRKG